jgi:hypothetical protein
MKGRLFFSLLFALCAVPVYGRTDIPLQYRYQETTGAKSQLIDYQIERTAFVVVTCTEPDERRRVVCKDSGSTHDWSLQQTDRDITARLENGRIKVSGVVEGKPVEKTFPKGDLPWFQLLSFSLRPFAQSDEDSIQFQFLRPDNLSFVKLEAKKNGAATIPVGGREETACHIRVSPPWPLSVFWQGNYWFRASDGLFLRFEGVNGPPGTKKTVVQFVE